MKNEKSYLIDDLSDDEIDTVEWIENKKSPIQESNVYSCGCCDDCKCDDMVKCINCNCECSLDFEDNEEININTNFDINIVKNEVESENKVRITLELLVNLNNDNKIILIDFDINQLTYLKIAEELFTL